jgi:LacI family transcriptional regulator
VVSEDLTNPFYPELVGPLVTTLAAHGLRTVVVTHPEHDSVKIDALADGSYDAVLLTTTTRRSSLPRDLTERGIPHVLVNRVLDAAESPSCAVDNAAGAGAVANLVADLGHSAVASIQGPTFTSTGRERADALRRGLRSRGIALPRAMVRRSLYSHQAGQDAALDLLRQRPRPTAIVCGNDVIALGALSAARLLGLRIPRDLTVVGFDDIPAAGWPLVDLTTVRSEFDVLATVAIDLLLDVLSGSDWSPEVQRVPVELVLRGTHGPPATQ